MKHPEKTSFVDSFRIPILVLGGIILYLILEAIQIPFIPLVIILATIAFGSFQLVRDSYGQILKNQFALDYIAIIAIIVSLLTQEYLVAAVLALMIASGRTLEEYGASQAKRTLTALIDRIPRSVHLWTDNEIGQKVEVESVDVGQQIFIRKGEVIPLDGVLISHNGIIDESSLTGEAMSVQKIEKDEIKSGTVNVGNPIVIKVTHEEKDSTYAKIINLVQKATKEKAPLVRLADKYSTIFTVVTFLIAGFAYYQTGTIESILAVLVVATPCPLILATPIALMGGVNAAAKKRIIIKKLSSLEILSRVNAVMFDKTGTITLGKPRLTGVRIFDRSMNQENILSVAEAR